jgi:hypothetical protein
MTTPGLPAVTSTMSNEPVLFVPASLAKEAGWRFGEECVPIALNTPGAAMLDASRDHCHGHG